MLPPKKKAHYTARKQPRKTVLQKAYDRLLLDYEALKNTHGDHTQQNLASIETPTLPTGNIQAVALEPPPNQINTLLDSMKEGFFSVDKNWIITYWNREAENILQRTRAELLGQNLWDAFPIAKNRKFFVEYNRAMDNTEPTAFEEFYPPTNTWFEVNAYPSEAGLLVIFKDMTRRKREEEVLRTINERHSLVAKATNDSIWDWDFKTGKVTRPGNLLETLYGYKGLKPEEVDAFWHTHAHAGDWETVTRRREEMLKDSAINYWEDEYRFRKADGRYSYVYDRAYIIRDSEGRAIRMIGASQDISKEKERVNEILRIQQNYESLINTTTDPMWSIDTNFKIITTNKAYREFILATSGKTIAEGEEAILELPATTIAHWSPLYNRAMTGETFDVEHSYTLSCGNLVHTIISFSPTRNLQGTVTGVACYQKDVTELKQAGQKLEELNNSLAARAEELATSNHELERFAYVASHDLQEPLRMVTGFLQLFEKKYKDRIDETANRYIHFSVDGAERMKRLINDLLQYSRVGTASLEMEKVNMNEVVNEVLVTFQHEINAHQVSVSVKNLPVIKAGRSAMLQVMQNLVGNALKYRKQDGAQISISVDEINDEWVFTIADNGIGIDEQFIQKVFEIFQRLHNKDEYSGTGIGLAICRKIVERYQGKIWAESVVDKGSRFIFTIPKNI